MNNMKEILYLIQQAGSLMLMPRTHKRSLGTTYDTVASHSHHVSIIAYCISRAEGLSHEDGLKAMAMGTLHDLAEARTGDLDFVAKHYTKADEAKAVKDQFEGLPFSEDLLQIIQEYEVRETLVSKCAKDADVLEQVFQEWVLSWQGNKLAEKWFDGDFKYRLPTLRTESAKNLMLAMKDSDPHEWWNQYVKKNNIDHLNSKK